MAAISITSRSAGPEDVPFLADCFLRSMRESVAASRGQWAEAREQVQFEHQLDLQSTRIIQTSDGDVGFLMLGHQHMAIQLHTLCIAPEWQGRGIGSQVTIGVIDLGRQTGRDVVLSVLKTNARAEALYRRLGFMVVGETEHHRHMKFEPRRTAATG